MPIKESRANFRFKGDPALYELEDDFGGKIGNLVNLEDFSLTVLPMGKYRIVDKQVTPKPGEPTVIVYQLERF